MLPLEFAQVADHVLKMPKLSQWANEIAGCAHACGVNPLILSAIIAQESGGRDPKIRGFDGHGRGLAQVDDRYHATFCQARVGGEKGQLLCEHAFFSIAYGANLLRENLAYFEGDLWPAVAAYNAGPGKVRRFVLQAGQGASPAERFKAANAATYGGEYLTRVEGFYRKFEANLGALKRKDAPIGTV